MLSVLIAAGLAIGGADTCTMQPPSLPIERLQQSRDVIATTIDQDRGRASVLLKDGRLLRVAAMGCLHSGMSAVLWLFPERPQDSHPRWQHVAEELSRLVFPDDVHALLAQALAQSSFVAEDTATGLIARILTPEDVSIEVEVVRLTLGTLVTITYAYH
ncbi:hypothetical protein E5843_00715 [Luteimonas yindakuii]|uniref:hypothetical protein n=1 Tax=Luteimonas yindakuii TaxID=2565782 RepID=UPI0010A2E930|nr:hypothetical protein [Luteimonas yindakuii]QCO66681.1 hypothetical protein E5843_00715 [Luteimonas yindakuii]